MLSLLLRGIVVKVFVVSVCLLSLTACGGGSGGGGEDGQAIISQTIAPAARIPLRVIVM